MDANVLTNCQLKGITRSQVNNKELTCNDNSAIKSIFFLLYVTSPFFSKIHNNEDMPFYGLTLQ